MQNPIVSQPQARQQTDMDRFVSGARSRLEGSGIFSRLGQGRTKSDVPKAMVPIDGVRESVDISGSRSAQGSLPTTGASAGNRPRDLTDRVSKDTRALSITRPRSLPTVEVAPSVEARAHSQTPSIASRPSVVDRLRGTQPLRQKTSNPSKTVVSPTKPDTRVEVTSPLGVRNRETSDSKRTPQKRQIVDVPGHGNTSISGYRGGDRARPVVYHDRPVVYHDRPVSHDAYHQFHTYVDVRRQICHRVVWPHYMLGIHYSFGLNRIVRPFYPYYHRKYVFISIGGWWPDDYSYLRYYWYGCHPFDWYGYYPVAREVEADTYNYYTYNYYGNDSSQTSGATITEPAPYDTRVAPNALQPVAPEPASPADRYFEGGVNAFENGDYRVAADQFSQAMENAPNDRIMPFAYAQSLFVDGRYAESAAALRVALDGRSGRTEVFYPRGLYKDDQTLFTQINQLMEKVDGDGSDTDLQLLAGYHLVGIGQGRDAIPFLEEARSDPRNLPAVEALSRLIESIDKDLEGNKGRTGPAGVAPEDAEQDLGAREDVMSDAAGEDYVDC